LMSGPGYARFVFIGEDPKVNEDCFATIGQVGTSSTKKSSSQSRPLRHRGIRPINRGVSRNPVDHRTAAARKSKSAAAGSSYVAWGKIAKAADRPAVTTPTDSSSSFERHPMKLT